MKYLKFSIWFVLCLVLCSSCGSLRPATATYYDSIDGYRYCYITPTNGRTSNAGSIYGNNYGVHGGLTSKSVNPSDLISGYLMKKGYTILPELNPELKDKTLIISYGESGKRDIGLFGYALEVTIQLISAQNHTVLCVGVAEGMGSTEADDIRIAINKCLDKIFIPNFSEQPVEPTNDFYF